jgi:hypothetical protein
LTSDEQLVKDVLALSNVVEIVKDSVRMVGWEQFVLPGAAKSVVEGINDEEDEDEDVVFVMGRRLDGDPHNNPLK